MGPTEEKALNRFVEQMQKAMGQNLVAVILYGSAARETYEPGRSDLNVLVVTGQITAGDLNAARAAAGRTARRTMIKPVFFTRAFLRSSTDTFPVEWSEMKHHNRILFGENVLAPLALSREHMRLQLEREVKQALISFQQGLFYDSDQAALLRISFRTVRTLLRGIEETTGTPVAQPSVVKTHEDFIRSKRNLRGRALENLIGSHLDFLQKLVQLIDTGSVS